MAREYIKFEAKDGKTAKKLQEEFEAKFKLDNPDLFGPSRRASDGVEVPGVARTLRYSDPIDHPDKESKNDQRILIPLDERAKASDRLNQTVVDESKAKKDGWFKDEQADIDRSRA